MDLIEVNNKNNNRHPWELSRTKCLISEIKKNHKSGNILDIGSGDTYFDLELLNSGINVNSLRGVDINLKEEIKSNGCIWTNDYKKLDIKKYDTIIMMDVIEHVECDSAFINETVLKLLNDKGRIILTVPAYQSLFSHHDEVLKHYRRYNYKMIKDLANKCNLKITSHHYFYLSLLLPRLLTKSKESTISNWKYSKNHIITKFIYFILNTDYYLCKLFGGFSAGLSLYAVLERK